MKAASTTIAKQQVLIEVLDNRIDAIGAPEGRQTEANSIDDIDANLSAAYDRAREIVEHMAIDFGEALKKAAAVKKVELEFSMGLSSTSGLWIISAKGECALKVKLTWEP